MVTITRLRILRFQHRITLPELAKAAGVSSQQLNRLELCLAKPTPYQEERISEALDKLITDRKSALVDLEHDYWLHKGRFLEALEVPKDEP